jgi:hypothetical protein
MGGARDARILHEPLGRVVLDAHLAFVEVEAGDRRCGSGEQHADGRPAGSRSDVVDAALPGREESLRRKIQRPVALRLSRLRASEEET